MKQQQSTQNTQQTVTILNEVQTADIWILPDTEENKKTTLWGSATASQLPAGESREVGLCEAGENGCYLLRMIDTESFYYAAGGITLNPGDTLVVQGEVLQSVTATVKDAGGSTVKTYEVFSARL